MTKILKYVKDTFRYYNTLIELHNLTNKELYDLGVTREQIPMIAAKAITTK